MDWEHCSWGWGGEQTATHSRHSHSHEGCQFQKEGNLIHDQVPDEIVKALIIHKGNITTEYRPHVSTFTLILQAIKSANV